MKKSLFIIPLLLLIGLVVLLRTKDLEENCVINSENTSINQIKLNEITDETFVDLDLFDSFSLTSTCFSQMDFIDFKGIELVSRINGEEENPFPFTLTKPNEDTFIITPKTAYIDSHMYTLKLNESLLGFSKSIIFTTKSFNHTFSDSTIELMYDFSEDYDGFNALFSHYYLVNNYNFYDEYNPIFYRTILPDSDEHGLFLSSLNTSDDVLMILHKKLDTTNGLHPNTTYQIQVNFDIYTNVAANQVGVGGAPGEGLFVKAGATNRLPSNHLTNANQFVDVNFFQNNQGGDAVDFKTIGNIAKEHSTDDSWELKSFTHTLMATTNEFGELWIVFGTDSGFEGTTSIYYTNVMIRLNEITKDMIN
ncbi:MAG: hypothetical protein ACOCUE_03475 [Candidatus Izemoplasmataceae bacterium]